MPTGETPQAQYKRGDSLAYGQANQANQADLPDYQPQGPAEQFLYGPTDHPAEPLTAGASFGPGPGPAPIPTPTVDQTVRSVAETALADPNAPKVLRQYAERVLRGE
jgi:hypothetical protein